MKNKKVANINVKIKDLFKRWLDITYIFHKLTEQERNVLALLLHSHYELKQDIKNEKVLWKMVFDYDTKMKIKEELDMKDAVMQNTLTSLRKKNVIKNNTIINTYIPDIEKGSNNFKIIYNLEVVDNG